MELTVAEVLRLHGLETPFAQTFVLQAGGAELQRRSGSWDLGVDLRHVPMPRAAITLNGDNVALEI
jgi:hypothetical protein